MTTLAEGFVDAFSDPDSLHNFPPTFETLTRTAGRLPICLARLPSDPENKDNPKGTPTALALAGGPRQPPLGRGD
jgi:hypothetical protein